MKQFLTIFFLTITIVSYGQQDFNKHNPYVNNSEIHWLRTKNINLFDTPINDDAFKINIRNSIDSRDFYRQKKRKFAAIVAGTVVAYSIGIAGLTLTNYSPTNNEDNKGFTSLYVGTIAIGIGGTIWSIVANRDRKRVKSAYEQQLQITKDQYNMLKGE